MPAVIEEKETFTEPTRGTSGVEKLAELLAGGKSTDAGEQEVDETAEEELPQETQPESKPVAEGPSPAMKLLARQSGVPDALLETAVNDAQIQQWVNIVASSPGESPPEPEMSFEYKVSLPEGEFDVDDPVRKEFANVSEHVNKIVKPLQSEISSLRAQLKSLVNESEAFQKAYADQEVTRFDETLDKLNVPALGQSSSRDANPAINIVRGAVWKYVEEVLLPKHPNASRADLAETAAKALGYLANKRTTEEKQAILDQSAQRLGSNVPAKAAPNPKLTGVTLFQAFLDGKVNRDGSPKL